MTLIGHKTFPGSAWPQIHQYVHLTYGAEATANSKNSQNGR